MHVKQPFGFAMQKLLPREWRERVAHAAGDLGNLDALAAASEDDGMVAHDVAAAQRSETDSAIFAFPSDLPPGAVASHCTLRLLGNHLRRLRAVPDGASTFMR